MVLLALGRDRRVVAAFEHYAPLVEGRWLRRRREHGRQRASGRRRASAPGPLEAVVPAPRPPPRLRDRPRPRALHGHVQPQRLPAAGGAAVTRPRSRRARRASSSSTSRRPPAPPSSAGCATTSAPSRLPDPGLPGTVEATLDVDLLVERFAAHRDEIRVVTGHFPLLHRRAARRRLRDLHPPARPGRANAVVPPPPAGGVARSSPRPRSRRSTPIRSAATASSGTTWCGCSR